MVTTYTSLDVLVQTSAESALALGENDDEGKLVLIKFDLTRGYDRKTIATSNRPEPVSMFDLAQIQVLHLYKGYTLDSFNNKLLLIDFEILTLKRSLKV